MLDQQLQYLGDIHKNVATNLTSLMRVDCVEWELVEDNTATNMTLSLNEN